MYAKNFYHHEFPTFNMFALCLSLAVVQMARIRKDVRKKIAFFFLPQTSALPCELFVVHTV